MFDSKENKHIGTPNRHSVPARDHPETDGGPREDFILLRVNEREKQELERAWRRSKLRGLGTYVRAAALQDAQNDRAVLPLKVQDKLDRIIIQLERIIGALNRILLSGDPLEAQSPALDKIRVDYMVLRRDIEELLLWIKKQIGGS